MAIYCFGKTLVNRSRSLGYTYTNAHGTLKGARNEVKMKSKYYVQKNGSVQNQLENALLVCRDFLALVNTYGTIGCVNHVAPSDKRFKLAKNGSYYELAGYAFTYGFMHDTDDVWWTCADFDATVIYNNPAIVGGKQRTTLGEAYVMFCRAEGVFVR